MADERADRQDEAVDEDERRLADDHGLDKDGALEKLVETVPAGVVREHARLHLVVQAEEGGKVHADRKPSTETICATCVSIHRANTAGGFLQYRSRCMTVSSPPSPDAFVPIAIGRAADQRQREEHRDAHVAREKVVEAERREEHVHKGLGLVHVARVAGTALSDARLVEKGAGKGCPRRANASTTASEAAAGRREDVALHAGLQPPGARGRRRRGTTDGRIEPSCASASSSAACVEPLASRRSRWQRLPSRLATLAMVSCAGTRKKKAVKKAPAESPTTSSVPPTAFHRSTSLVSAAILPTAPPQRRVDSICARGPRHPRH